LSVYCGAGDSEYVRAIARRWPISAVARASRPGAKVDHTLLLQAPQGAKKSSGLEALPPDPDWFADHLSELASKDSRLELLGIWILELAELDRVRGAALERVKNFLTTRRDHFRLPYGRRAQDIPRTTVFCATTNDDTPFMDSTGNRRFWPVRCGEIDVDGIARDRDQLWAEARDRYLAGAPWWLETPELNALATTEQAERRERDAWEPRILAWCEKPEQREIINSMGRIPVTPFESMPGRVTLQDILAHGLEKPLERWTPADERRVVHVLKANGWQRKQARSGPHRGRWFYERADLQQFPFGAEDSE